MYNYFIRNTYYVRKSINVKTDLIYIASTFSSVSYITFTGKLSVYIDS